MNNYQTHYLPHRHVKKDSSTAPQYTTVAVECPMTTLASTRCWMPTGSFFNHCTRSYSQVWDIEKAFLHVQLNDDDRHYICFLWLSNPEDPESEFDTYHFNMLFGATSSRLC